MAQINKVLKKELKKFKKKKLFIIYDARATYDVDKATCLCTADTLKEAKEDCEDYGESCVFEYDVDGKYIINGEMVYHYMP